MDGAIEPMTRAFSSIPLGSNGRAGPAREMSGESTLISSFDSAASRPQERTFDDHSPSDRTFSLMGSMTSVISTLSYSDEPREAHPYQSGKDSADDDRFLGLGQFESMVDGTRHPEGFAEQGRDRW